MQKKEGLPEENEIVLCTVTKIQHHSVFCNLDEYDKSGMLHISEISSGRVRNITEYVREGKTIVCKVLKIDQERGYIDLSLRRVTEAQRKSKAASIKKHQFADKLIGQAATELGAKPEDIWRELEENLQHETVFDLFQGVVENNEKLPIKDPAKTVLTKIISEKLKPASVTIKGKLELTTYDQGGVGLIKDAFSKAPKLEITYLGGGQYSIHVTAKDYKKAEALLKEQLENVTGALEKKAAKLLFTRTDR